MSKRESELYHAFKRAGIPIIDEVPPRPHEQFGKNVCRLRMERCLTQEKLAEMADISRRYLQQIEAGKMNPTINIASRLREAFACGWSDLLQRV